MEPINIVEKEWGVEFWVLNELEYCFKVLELAPGKRCSLHRHIQKTESFVVREGECLLNVGLEYYGLTSSSKAVRIPAGTWHRFSNYSARPCIILEISTHHEDSDCERREPSGDVPR